MLYLQGREDRQSTFSIVNELQAGRSGFDSKHGQGFFLFATRFSFPEDKAVRGWI
jgi:hypothetical protein